MCFQLSSDQICLTAIKNMTTVYTSTAVQEGTSDMTKLDLNPENANLGLLQVGAENGFILKTLRGLKIARFENCKV